MKSPHDNKNVSKGMKNFLLLWAVFLCLNCNSNGQSVVWATQNTKGWISECQSVFYQYSLDQTLRLAADQTGNSYLYGSYSSPSLAFNNFVINDTSFDKLFLAKFAADGSPKWLVGTSGGGSDQDQPPVWVWPQAIAIDNKSDALVIGRAGTSVFSMGALTLSSGNPSDDVGYFLIKLDSNGQTQWGLNFSGNSDSDGYPVSFSLVASDDQSNIYIAGGCQGSFTLGGKTFIDTNASSGFLAKLDQFGNAIWIKRLGASYFFGSNFSDFSSIYVGDSGRILLSGISNADTLTYDGHSLFLSGTFDYDMRSNCFLIAIDSSGNFLWGKSTSGSGLINSCFVYQSADGLSNLIVYKDTGSTYWDAETLSKNRQTYLFRIDQTGSATTIVDLGNINIFSFVKDGADNFYLNGIAWSIATLDSTYVSEKQLDLFKFSKVGNILWASSTYLWSQGIVMGAGDSGIIVTGTFYASEFDLSPLNILYNYSPDSCLSQVFVALLDTVQISSPNNSLPILTGIYPNPNHGNFDLLIDSTDLITQINIYDQTGRLLPSSIITDITPRRKHIEMPPVRPGIYYLESFGLFYRHVFKLSIY